LLAEERGLRITEVRACQPRCASPPDWRTSLGQILVAVDTDVGLTGYGVGGGGAAGIHIVRTVIRDLLHDRSPEPIETLWQAMYRATLPFGRKGVAIMALSGVDLALWDLRGKAERKAVADLLGGVWHPRIPTYGTAWDSIPDEILSQHTAFKLHLGTLPPANLVEATARARERIGPIAPLMVDAWMLWDVPLTLDFARQAASCRLDWIEEPLSPDDLDGYAELVRSSPTPIAGGEHEFTAAAFAELITRRLHQVVQPDVCWCGGMTELVKIYRLAAQHGVRVCPHRGAELWSLPALAALDPQPLAESGRPWMTWVGGQPPIRDGWIELPEGPGFGVRMDEAKLDTMA
jgi:L-rhamnonate dehydratase